MAAHLRVRFSTTDLIKDPDSLRAFVVEGMQEATRFGVLDRYDVRRFLEFRAEYGAGFDKLPWASKILNDRTLSGCGKMDQIDVYSVFTLRPGRNE